MKKELIVTLMLCTTQLVSAESYIRDYTYSASEADSKITSRTIALDQLKTLLLQEIGVSIKQTINISKSSTGDVYASEDIEAVTAGITKIDILNETWDGKQYYIKANIIVDEKQIMDSIKALKELDSIEKSSLLASFKENETELKNARSEIDRLRKEMSLKKTNITDINNSYIKEVNSIYTGDINRAGFEKAKFGLYGEAYEIFLKAAESDNAIAQYNIGYMYEEGIHVGANLEKAAHWYKLSAENDYELAQLKLGVFYMTGQGLEQNYKEAFHWNYKAAIKGNNIAQMNLGTLYEMGRGAEQNLEKSRYWYSQSAAQGNATSEYALKMLNKRSGK